ncbi:uncharacterized protein CDV56_100859 [Aspergillus thermomutatus]|uniref:Uncharacterized protein n=1 Tax=Aspergillus thermomutatus TaxID=41047 RepID=A0A397G2P1_ASPTH|nr:uncharacterized protein CDV56_100859 [Aspergillus thermomutatus]RHZ43838.1 hypothetical protein CDV56_100859 [Aspergillus thermomutatus]
MTSSDVPQAFDKNRVEAFKLALADFPDGLTKTVDFDAIRLLDKVRDHNDDWSTNSRAQPVAAPLTAPQQRSAALLHQRGEKLSDADCCSRCRDNKGVWQSCVVAPIYQNKALHSYACTNCIYYKRPSDCSLRSNFQEKGGSAWVSTSTETVLQRGGLLAAITQDRLEQAQQERAQRERAQRERAQRERAQRERAQRERAQRERAQQERAHKRRERESELETLPRSGRRTEVSVVVHSPGPVAKRSKTTGRTLGWSKKLLKSDELEPVITVIAEMQAFLALLIAHKDELVMKNEDGFSDSSSESDALHSSEEEYDSDL